jgi:hypothetical protein
MAAASGPTREERRQHLFKPMIFCGPSRDSRPAATPGGKVHEKGPPRFLTNCRFTEKIQAALNDTVWCRRLFGQQWQAHGKHACCCLRVSDASLASQTRTVSDDLHVRDRPVPDNAGRRRPDRHQGRRSADGETSTMPSNAPSRSLQEGGDRPVRNAASHTLPQRAAGGGRSRLATERFGANASASPRLRG